MAKIWKFGQNLKILPKFENFIKIKPQFENLTKIGQYFPTKMTNFQLKSPNTKLSTKLIIWKIEKFGQNLIRTRPNLKIYKNLAKIKKNLQKLDHNLKILQKLVNFLKFGQNVKNLIRTRPNLKFYKN